MEVKQEFNCHFFGSFWYYTKRATDYFEFYYLNIFASSKRKLNNRFYQIVIGIRLVWFIPLLRLILCGGGSLKCKKKHVVTIGSY